MNRKFTSDMQEKQTNVFNKSKIKQQSSEMALLSCLKRCNIDHLF